MSSAAHCRRPRSRLLRMASSPRKCSRPITRRGVPAAATSPCSRAFYRVLEKLNYPHEKIVTFAGIGCSSRFPYFVNTHGGHFIHGRALPFAAGISLASDDLHVFVFGGDGDGFSIGGNHLVHTARKNVRTSPT